MQAWEPDDTLMAELALAARTAGDIDHEFVASLVEELDQRFFGITGRKKNCRPDWQPAL